ncbi:MAG: hypothetical protein ACRDZX_00920 [Acidimicrobiales bacterium]
MSRLVQRVGAFALVGLLIVVGIWYAALWRPETSHLRAEGQLQSQAASNVASLQGQLASLQVLSKRVPAERKALSKLDQAVPDGPSLDQLLDAINTAAAKAGVPLTAIGTPMPTGWGQPAASPGSAASAPATGTTTGPPSISLTISIGGTAARVLKFVTALGSQRRLFVVDSFSLTTSPATSPASGKSRAPATGLGTSLTVEAFYVSATSANPASTFPLMVPPSQVAAYRAAVKEEHDAVAKAEALNALVYEKAFRAANRAYVDATTPLGVKALGSGTLPWSTTRVPSSGQVAAIAGRARATHWLPTAPGGRGPALLVESLSQSGTCFYVADYTKGGEGAYAETTGGCAPSVALPATVRKGAPARVKAAASGLTSADWYSGWQ